MLFRQLYLRIRNVHVTRKTRAYKVDEIDTYMLISHGLGSNLTCRNIPVGFVLSVLLFFSVNLLAFNIIRIFQNRSKKLDYFSNEKLLFFSILIRSSFLELCCRVWNLVGPDRVVIVHEVPADDRRQWRWNILNFIHLLID